MVHIEWDRGHESCDAIIRASSDTGVVVTEVFDLVALPGYKWIRADEILEIDDLDDDDPAVRVRLIRGSTFEPVGAELADIRGLSGHLADRSIVTMIQTTRTGSGEGLVGRIASVNDAGFALSEIDTNGRATGDTLTYAFESVISVEWGTSYLDALTDLNTAD